MINSFKEANDHEGFKLAVILNFGIDTTITAEELEKDDVNALAENLYMKPSRNYNHKKKALVEQTMPIIKNIRKEQGNHIENVAVPFTDGKKAIQALANLDKYFETDGCRIGQCAGTQYYAWL